VIRSLLEDSLVLWKLRGRVEKDGDAFLICSESGSVVRIAPGRRSRWLVSDAECGERECASMVSALSAIRERLDVSEGLVLRIAPGRRDA